MNTRCYFCGLDLVVPVNHEYCPVHSHERNREMVHLYRRARIVASWQERNRSPLPDYEPAPLKPSADMDAFQLAALHKHLVAVHRHADANMVLERLHELAARPVTADAMRRDVD